jgi:hypothetical protein
MNKLEVGKVLTVAMAIDSRLNASDENAFRAKVEGWSLALSDSMTFEFARDAVARHYANVTDSVMPAHLNAAWSSNRHQKHEINNVRAIGSAAKSQGMPDDVRAKLVEMGLKRP